MDPPPKKKSCWKVSSLSDFPAKETVPSLTSDMGKKTGTVLAHLFLLP